MHKLWIGLGRVVYWLIYPGLIMVLPLTHRTRVLVTAGDEVLVVRGWLDNGRWMLPGGGLHRGEDPAVGAQREVREETGLEIATERLVNPQARYFRAGLRRCPYQLFVVRLEETVIVRGRWPEIVDCAWIARTDLNSSNADYDVLDALASVQPVA